MQAVIDLGTNTFNLAVGEILHGRLFLHHTAWRGVLLKKEGLVHGAIAQSAWQRASLAVKELLSEAREAGATQVFALATSALRDAADAKLWMLDMQRQFNLPIRIIGGVEEAHLIWKGLAASGALHTEALSIDIGGGSVEFVHANDKKIFWLESIDMGMARVQNAIAWSDPITEAEVLAVRSWLHERILPVLEYASNKSINRLVGAAGAFDTLYCLCHNKATPAAWGYVERNEVLKWTNELVNSTRHKRAALPYMPALRVDSQVYAMLLLEALLIAFPSIAGIDTSTYSLREGALLHANENPGFVNE